MSNCTEMSWSMGDMPFPIGNKKSRQSPAFVVRKRTLLGGRSSRALQR